MSDPRFTRLRTDPRFRKPKKHLQKVVVDERFNSIFEDDGKGTNGKLKSGRVDKYGRRISDKHEKTNLRRFYRLEGEENQETTPNAPDYARGEVLLESSSEDEGGEVDQNNQESDDGGDVVLGRHASKPIPVGIDEDYLEVDLNEDEDIYADLDAEAAAYNQELVEDEETEGEDPRTSRLAIVNLDWDHVRAHHLYKIFSSLVSPTGPLASVDSKNSPPSGAKSMIETSASEAKVIRGRILCVRVYPSEFGKARMKKEEVEGPPREVFKKGLREDSDDESEAVQEDNGDEYNEDALRTYQLERLRYYYAIVSCDSINSASHLMSELDGTELERTANVFDLSFVPEDMTFGDDFRDEATSATQLSVVSFKGLDFSTDALRHSKVKLKWDEDDPERNKITRRALSRKEIEEGDYKAYIASSGSDDTGDEGTASVKTNSKGDRDRLRSLLLGGSNDNIPEGWDTNPFGDDNGGDDDGMEITFLPGLSEAARDDDNETTLEKYKRKQKEKRQQRKSERATQKGLKDDENKMKDTGDDFFGGESSGEGEEGTPLKNSKNRSQREVKDKSAPRARPTTDAELALLAVPDDLSSEHKHFDMKSILKAEKAKGRKKVKKVKKKGTDEGPDEMQEEFQIDVKDSRFKSLHDDHAFAIDPTNPHFKKTNSMAALLDERGQRQRNDLAVHGNKGFNTKEAAQAEQSLQSLVESVKRKSLHLDGKGVGKRRRL